MSRWLSVSLSALGILMLAVLAACSAPTSGAATATAVPVTASPEPIPTPESGTSTVTGRLVDTATKQPYANQVVRLAEILHIDPGDGGTWMIDDATSPGDYTNEQGFFVIPSVAAKEYVLVVGDFHVRYAIVTDTPDNAAVWVAPADQILDVGQVDVVLP